MGSAGRAIRHYVARQIDGIGERRSLRALGAILALLNVATIEWWFHTDAVSYLSSAAEPICWPLIPDCAALHILTTHQLGIVFRALELAALVVALCFFRRRTLAHGYFGVVALMLAKGFLMAIDFRTRMNQHYMLIFVSTAFVFVANRPLFCRLLVVGFYVAAGFLKFNADWLTGASLYRPLLLLAADHLPIATRYAIVLELVIAWGLLARSPLLFWAAFVQLVAFHVVSIPVVGFFYPLVCLGFLAFVAIERRDGEREPFVLERNLGGVALLAGFCGLQLIPRVLSADPALTGEGRLWALHMFDGRIECRSEMTLKFPDGRRSLLPTFRHTEVRTACDPIVFWDHARNACNQRSDAASDVDLLVFARHASDPIGSERRLIDVRDFCRTAPHYHVLRHNAWILP